MFHFKKEEGWKKEREGGCAVGGEVLRPLVGAQSILLCRSWDLVSGVNFVANHCVLIAGFLIEFYFQAVLCYKSVIDLPNFILVLTKCYRYAIVRDMTAAGAGLDKFCYAGLIAAHTNKIPRADDTATKVIFCICF